MAEYITRIRTEDGDLPIDYNSLWNKPESDINLKTSGAFADAKIVGDHIGSIYEEMKKLSDNTVPNSTTINGKSLKSNVVLSPLDIGAPDNNHEHLFDRAVTTTGTGQAYTVTLEGIEKLEAGLKFTMIPHTTSTSISPTLTVNNLGAKSLKQPIIFDSLNSTTPTSSSWLSANKPVVVMYDGTSWQAISYFGGVVPIKYGGTEADTAEKARTNLGITPANIGALPKVLTSDYYGDYLPGAGTKGRIFFKKAGDE